jgi:hypothetical protein
MEQIIRICQSRGVFKPEEMIHVGILYKKIVDILEKTKTSGDPMNMLGAFQGLGGASSSQMGPIGPIGPMGPIGPIGPIGPMGGMRMSGRDSGTSMNM